ncbi:MAG: long-chain fatty acid--CoA ligase [Candidatus Thorarchaeota archaeon]|nr:MAG: long-chain fatty acid--CoA ligase [Candidatus Thorarchaeota archaeon]
MKSEDWDWIGDWAGRRAILTPKKEAVFDSVRKRRFNFAEVDSRANQLARVLMNQGIEKGDRIAVYAKNRFEYFDFFFASGKIGAVLVPLNIRLVPRELEFMIRKTGPSLIVYDSDLSEPFSSLRDSFKDTARMVMGDKAISSDKSVEHLLTKVSSNPVERPQLAFDDPCMVIFTGGTTGLPKGAILSHRLVFWNSTNTLVSWGIRPDDVQPLLFPLFHTGGWNVLVIPFFHMGGRTIIMGDFDANETLRVIESEKCTIVIGVPTMFNMMSQAKSFEDADFGSVRVFISGGAPCPVAIMEKYWARNKPFKMGYGLTEVGPNNFYLPEDNIKRKPKSVGFPVFHSDTKIVDAENMEVPVGKVGELLLRGPHIFSGYWDEPDETSSAIESDGWVHTGDLASVDEEGFYYIVGRKKEMWISGGENVFPSEIEEILYQHPAILEAAVIGIPDDFWGEVGKAFLVLKEGLSLSEEEIREYLTVRLAKYKIPKHYEFRETLPKSAAGKILKRDLL